MARFNLEDYDTVEVRIRKFYAEYPDGRIITENLTTLQDRQVSTWVVKAEIWLPAWELDEKAHAWFVQDAATSAFYLKATGHAFEVDGGSGANQASALENCETSAIGRALANMNMSGNKRASREEMAKAERAVTPQAPARPWLVEADEMKEQKNLVGLRELYNTASRLKVSEAILKEIIKRADGLSES